MKPKRQTDVTIVGAGPVGLFAALCLAEQDVTVQIIDRDWIGSAHSYALALHPATLSMLDELGLAEPLVEQGQRITRIGFYDGKTQRAAVELEPLGGRFPFVLVLPQSKLEGELEERLSERGVRVLWNHQLLAIEEWAEGGVGCELGRLDRVSLGYPIARTEWIVDKRFESNCSFLIGADGYHSFTRRSLGTRFEDHGGAESFAVFEFRAPFDLGGEMRVVFHENMLNVLWPMAGARGRWSFQVEREAPQPDRAPDRGGSSLETLLSSRAPWFEPRPAEVFWATDTRFERRLTEQFGSGHVWLAGDAAHVTGPVGAQSMNVGLREAWDLADRIGSALRRDGTPKLFEIYQSERRAEWQRLLGLEGPPAAGPEANDWVKAHAARLLPCLPASGEGLAAMLQQLGLRWS